MSSENPTAPPDEEARTPDDEQQGPNDDAQPKDAAPPTDEDMEARLERLGGEPAPDITPEEFARLQQSGQIHIDPRGRVRRAGARQSQDAGVSLRKRRAWYCIGDRPRLTATRPA